MPARLQLTTVALCLILAAPFALQADIYRWDNGQVIPGTEGIWLGPGVQLDHRALEYANLHTEDLTGASFEESNLTHADLWGSTLTRVNLTGANLTGANLIRATLTNANLTGANLRTADLSSSIGLHSASMNAATVYNQWTVFPAGFDPMAAGLTLAVSPTGDLDADDVWDADDVDMLAERIGFRLSRWTPLPDAAFDVNGDGAVDLKDHRTWVKDLRQTDFGDANLDGGYEQASRPSAAVPEPTSGLLAVLALGWLMAFSKPRWRR